MNNNNNSLGRSVDQEKVQHRSQAFSDLAKRVLEGNEIVTTNENNYCGSK